MLALVACNDWLDVKPATQIDREELLSSEKGYGEAIRGIYSQMSDASLYGREMTWGSMDILAGNYSIVNSSGYYGLRQYLYNTIGDKQQDAEAVNIVGVFWTKLYNTIAGINSILDGIGEKEELFSDDNYSVVRGEAIGLRAFLHFELLRMFGDTYEKSKDVPVLPYVTELTPKVTPFLSGDNALRIIILQLEEALTMLENDPMRLGTSPSSVLASIPAVSADNNIHAWHNRRFHFNYYAAKATLARAYLWRGGDNDKVTARKLALDVIAEQESRFPWVLEGNLTSIESGAVANQDRTFATEHIFALNVTDVEELIAGYLNSLPATIRLFSENDVFTQDERGSDPRYKYMYTLYTGKPLLSKFYQLEVVSPYFKFRIPLIRISEMYYIAAECAESWQKGSEYLEAVRERRGMSSMPLNVNSMETLQAEILREYRKEFAGEGQLWFYYKRHQATAIANMTDFPGLDAYVFPIPEDEELYGNRN